MLVLGFKLDETSTLTDAQTGRHIATVRVASFVQFPNHTEVRLGFEAPQNVRILRNGLGSKGLEDRNGQHE